MSDDDSNTNGDDIFEPTSLEKEVTEILNSDENGPTGRSERERFFLDSDEEAENSEGDEPTVDAPRDATPARTHEFAPEVIESMIEGDSRFPNLITLTGARAGETVRLESDRIVIGRHRDEVDVWIGDRGVSRRHAMLERSSDGAFFLRDLESSNGTYVNGERVTGRRRLEDGDKIFLSNRIVLKFSLQDPLDEQFQRHMYESSVRDGLTGAYTRSFFEEQMRTAISFADRHDTDAALVLLDIDCFKDVNDRHGHVVGDEVLVELSDLLRSIVRTEDLLARYGGEEFAILLRHTNFSSVDCLTERIRTTVESATFEARDERVNITVSLGGALYEPAVMDDPKDWIAAADRALYDAKAAGRNRARFFEGDRIPHQGDDGCNTRAPRS